jgi:hypothetical protein
MIIRESEIQMAILMENMELMTVTEITYIIINVQVAMDSIVSIVDQLFHLNTDLSGILKRALKWLNTTKRESESVEIKKEKKRENFVKDVENVIVR